MASAEAIIFPKKKNSSASHLPRLHRACRVSPHVFVAPGNRKKGTTEIRKDVQLRMGYTPENLHGTIEAQKRRWMEDGFPHFNGVIFRFKMSVFRVVKVEKKDQRESGKLKCSRKGPQNKIHARFLFKQDPLKAYNDTLILVWTKAFKNLVKPVENYTHMGGLSKIEKVTF